MTTEDATAPVAWMNPLNGVVIDAKRKTQSEGYPKFSVPLYPAAPAPVEVAEMVRRLQLSADGCRSKTLPVTAEMLTEAAAIIERLAAEKAEAERAFTDFRACTDQRVTADAAEIEAQRARAEAAERALQKYGRHERLCGAVGGYGYCDCGLDAARAPKDA